MYRHVDVYLDESGDLGFSPTGSQHLIVVALATAEPHKLARLVRRAHRRFGMTAKGGAEFKFNKSTEQLRRHFLLGLANMDCWISWGGVTKSQAGMRLRSDKSALWQYVASRALSELSGQTHARSMDIIVDRFSDKPNLNRALASRLAQEVESRHVGHFPPAVRVRHLDPRKSEGLQVADFAAGAVFQSVERNEHRYLRLIGERIVHG